MTDLHPEKFHVFLSHSHQDAIWVKDLAERLEDECGFHVWLDKWILIPGKPWQQGMARGLEQAESCAVCIGKETPKGWFKEEIQKALNRQTQDDQFRVIPVLLPESDANNVNDFLELRTWVDFRFETERAFYELGCGINGVAPGRFILTKQNTCQKIDEVEKKLKEFQRIRDLLHPETRKDVELEIVMSWVKE